MDIEKALKNIGDWISKETESIKYPKGELLELSESLQALKAAITRRSATSEEVAEAIEYLQPLTEHPTMSGNFAKHLKTAIAALQAYQPTTLKDRIVEEVAISKTETTSCEWCEIARACEYEVTFFKDDNR